MTYDGNIFDDKHLAMPRDILLNRIEILAYIRIWFMKEIKVDVNTCDHIIA